MKAKKITAVGFIVLMLIILAAGCGPAKTAEAAGDFSMEGLANTNSTESVFKKFNSVRVESTYYTLSESGEWTTYQHTRTLVKGNDGFSIYTVWSSGSENAIFKDIAYFKHPDGRYGFYACIDGGCYEQLYLPELVGLIYAPIMGEKVTSNTVENGVRRLVVQSDIEGSYAESLGITQGVIESVYELDVESGLILRASESAVTGGKAQKLAEGSIHYGENDAFTEPEYVALCRDMSDTRTVHYVLDAGKPEEKTFTFTLPKKAELAIYPEDVFGTYSDPEYAVAYFGPPDGIEPDEITIYVKKF